MSYNDPIADMLTRIRNAHAMLKKEVSMYTSKQKKAIASILQQQGFIESFSEVTESKFPVLKIKLKYFNGKPVIVNLKRVSRPGLRHYVAASDIPKVPGFGIAIVSTSKGMMTDIQARKENVGGELICLVA